MLQVFLHVVTHSPRHESLHEVQDRQQTPEHEYPQSMEVSAALATIGLDAKIATPKIGNAAFAAFLKKSRRD